MAAFVSLVLNRADRIPLVGSPIGQATSWYRQKGSSAGVEETISPPPYEKVAANSRLTQLSDYVLKRTSFSSAGGTVATTSTAPSNVISTVMLDGKEIQNGVRLLELATEMNNTSPSNLKASIDLYMMGLERVLTSLPIHSDPVFKTALESKLIEFTERYNLVLYTPSTNIKKLDEIEPKEALGGLSELIIHAAIKGAIALKRSPIPDLMSKLIQMTKESLLKIDESYSIRKRAYNISTLGLAKAMELDEYYEVHQFFAELFYTGCTAILKAGKAYAEAEVEEDMLNANHNNSVMISSPLRIAQTI